MNRGKNVTNPSYHYRPAKLLNRFVISNKMANFALKWKGLLLKIISTVIIFLICMYALRLLGNKEEAEDVVQSSFASAWERLQNGVEISEIKSYLYGTARNLAYSKLRSSKKLTERTSFRSRIGRCGGRRHRHIGTRCKAMESYRGTP